MKQKSVSSRKQTESARLPARRSQPGLGSSSPSPGLALPDTIDRGQFDKLTPREQLFVQHPQVMSHAVTAAIESGYAKGAALSKAYSMRKQLMYYIHELAKHRMEERGIDLKRVERELGAVAFAREVDYYEKTDTEDDTILVAKDPTLLPEEMKIAIRSIHTENVMDAEGKGFQLISYVLHDKIPALKMLAEMLGGFDPKNRAPGDAETRRRQAELFDYMSPEDLRTVERIYAAAAVKQSKAMKDKIADKEALRGEAKTIS